MRSVLIKNIHILSLIIITLAISGCSELELASHFGKNLINDSSQNIGTYKVGSAYTVKGRRYYPAVNYKYDQTGIASWYGPNFHGKKTANGEIFDENKLTAAHKTLPLPTIVRVTNLENGRSLVVRINDRGPYANGRIIDLSKRSAELLGFKNKGTAKVRVQVLEPESRQIALSAQSGQDTRGVEIPMNMQNYKSPKIKIVNLTKQNNNLSSMRRPMLSTNQNIDKNSVTPQRLFVQTGAFSTRESAMKYASSLDKYGRAQISSIIVNGNKYYRVRFPAKNVNMADNLLKLLYQNGHKNALIVVD